MKISKLSISISILSICISCSDPYTIRNKADKSRQIYIVAGDSIVNAFVWLDNKPVKVQENKTYFWHYKDKINNSQGGYFGQLLHDECTVLDLKTNVIISKCKFDKGLKNGKCLRWYLNGKLKERSIWSNGKQVGKTDYFDNNGLIINISHKNKTSLKPGKYDYTNPVDSLHGKVPIWKRVFHRKQSMKNNQALSKQNKTSLP